MSQDLFICKIRRREVKKRKESSHYCVLIFLPETMLGSLHKMLHLINRINLELNQHFQT